MQSKFLFVLLVYFFNVNCIHGRDLSPLSFGLRDATTDTERYNVLYNTHVAAVERGVNVDYSGIESIEIEIPINAKPIPLTSKNDFKGLKLYVNNHYRRQAIFQMYNSFTPVEVSKLEIDKGEYKDDILSKGLFLLSIEDKTPWVEQRRGYKYGHQRKDIVLVNNGHSINKPIASYCSEQSSPKVAYLKTSSRKKTIRNISIFRMSQATKVPICFYIYGQNNVLVENVTIKTPENTLYMDAAIAIENCTNIKVNNITIEGTYSQIDEYGYGFFLDNVWNSSFSKLSTKSKWGIFGNNNINVCKIKDSRINRFDIHCYGRDVSISNCEFFDLYNQFSSLFGYLRFHKCSFNNFTPVLFESTYNAYTNFDLFFDKCTFYPNKEKNYIINAGFWDDIVNPREELNSKSWPNVSIKKLTIKSNEPLDCVYLFYLRSDIIGDMKLEKELSVSINELDIIQEGEPEFKIVNHTIKSKKKPVYNIRRVRGGMMNATGIYY